MISNEESKEEFLNDWSKLVKLARKVGNNEVNNRIFLCTKLWKRID